VTGNLNLELPFGADRRWLTGKSVWASLFGGWRMLIRTTLESGTPLTPRVLSSASELTTGTNGTLRANYNGEPVALADPSIDRFFNTAAFSVPPAGSFGNASRNMIIGPGTHTVDMQLARDLTLPASRTITIQINANNVFNLINYRSVDTVVNSPAFGQITSVGPMRSVQLTVRVRY
jgi:hypothetical protein